MLSHRYVDTGESVKFVFLSYMIKEWTKRCVHSPACSSTRLVFQTMHLKLCVTNMKCLCCSSSHSMTKDLRDKPFSPMSVSSSTKRGSHLHCPSSSTWFDSNCRKWSLRGLVLFIVAGLFMLFILQKSVVNSASITLHRDDSENGHGAVLVHVACLNRFFKKCSSFNMKRLVHFLNKNKIKRVSYLQVYTDSNYNILAIFSRKN